MQVSYISRRSGLSCNHDHYICAFSSAHTYGCWGEGGKGAFLYDQWMKAELGSQMDLLSKLKMTAAALQPYSGVT